MEEAVLTREEKQVLNSIASILFEKQIDLKALQKMKHGVSIDLGGGNVSAAWTDLRSPDQKVQTLKMFVRNEESVWSMVGFDGLPGSEHEGMVTVGKTVRNRRYRYSNYKIVPTDQNLKISIPADNDPENPAAERTVRELTEMFLTQLMKGIRENKNNHLLGQCDLKDILVIVGHPTSERWKDQQARKNLEDMVRRATGVSQVLTMAESNSAILYAMENRPNLGKAARVLIIDLGATTADITYIDKATRRHVEASIDLGGKQIDANLETIGLDKWGSDPAMVSENLCMEARAIKEGHWPRGTSTEELIIKLKNDRTDTVSLTPGDFDRAVTDAEYGFDVYHEHSNETVRDSYTGHLRRFLEEAKQGRKNADGSYTGGIEAVDYVLVTGGAARMKPALETIREAVWGLWDVPQERIWPDQINDSLINDAVSHGSLHYYLKAQKAMENLPQLYRDLKNAAQSITGPLAEALARELTPYLMQDVVLDRAKAWRDYSSGCDKDALMQKIRAACQRPSVEARIQQICLSTVSTATRDHHITFQSIITEFMKSLYQIHAGEAVWKMPDLSTDGIDFANVLADQVSQALAEQMSSLLEDIFLILAFLLVGWIPDVVESVTDWFVETFGTASDVAEREKQKAEKKRQQDARKRADIYNKLNTAENLASLQQKLKAEIQSMLEAECKQNAFGIPAAYMNQLVEDIRKFVYTG